MVIKNKSYFEFKARFSIKNYGNLNLIYLAEEK